MAVILALPKLFDDVSARFAAEDPTVSLYFGWREPSKHKESAKRIVFVPGDPGGNLGEIRAPRGPGSNPRPLANLGELFTVRIEAYDATNAENERVQYQATRELFDAWYRAVYLAAHGNFEIASSEWDTSKNERRHGAAIIVVAEILSVIPDAAHDSVSDAEADITTRVEDASEVTTSRETP